MSLVTGVDFVALPAKDFDESVRFYEEVLELPVRVRWGKAPGIEFQVGNLTLAIMEPTAFGSAFKPHSLPLAFQVDDVPAAREQLQAQGVEFTGEIIDSGFGHQAIVKDPAGNTLDLHHRYAGTPS